MRYCTDRRGIALPVTIFIITLMTITLAAAFARVGAERQVAVGASETISALTVAQSGLQQYLGAITSRPPDGDSVRFNLTGGYADVVARFVESDSVDDERMTYIVRSTGYVIVPAQGATAQAKRTVAQFAVWQKGSIDAVAAYTAANRVERRNGGTVNIRGQDNCGQQPALYGLRTRNGSNVSPTTGITGSPSGYYENDNGNTVAGLANINWQAVTTGGFIPDYYSYRAWDTSYPSMLIQGDLPLGGFFTGGYGLLIVTGDLTIQSTFFVWNGVILVGGKIDFDSQQSWIYGNVKSGLNELLGGGAPPRGYFAGTGRTLTLRYDSCRIQSAMATLTGFVPVRNAWVDNWASY